LVLTTKPIRYQVFGRNRAERGTADDPDAVRREHPQVCARHNDAAVGFEEWPQPGIGFGRKKQIEDVGVLSTYVPRPFGARGWH